MISKKKNFFASFLNVLFPGLAQIFRGQWMYGITFAISFVAVFVVFAYAGLLFHFWGMVVGLLIGVVIYIYNIHHAYSSDIPFFKWPYCVGLFLVFCLVATGVEGVVSYPVRKNIIGIHEIKSTMQGLNEGDYLISTPQFPENKRDYILLLNQDTGSEVIYRTAYYETELQELAAGVHKPIGQPLYIIWSSDLSRIGKRLDEITGE